ncbi:MAG TPA: DUF2490 domain-containing protein [Cyclobacteriaceae bacterium]|nr:DUF2490 domain-containing protein [Cyclobacteriaceae bacterium]
MAVGITQQLGTRWQSSFYIGGARQSNPDNYSFLGKSAIYVLDIQNAYRFNDRWQLAGCVSYRGQSRYRDDAPYLAGDPALRTEVRYYMRLYYRHKIKRTAFTWSLRPEYRTYFNHSDQWDPVPVELRLRFKVQAAFPLNSSRSNQIVVGNEWLSVTDHRVHTGEVPHWTHYEYTEDRLTTYFRHTFAKPSVIVDAGLMYQITAHNGLITHLAFDVIFVDPFKVGEKL